MGMTSGVQPMGTYGGTLGENIAELKAFIPDPGVRESPNPREPGSMLDEMSPMAAAQLRVELDALDAAADAGGDDVAYGFHTITAGEASANLVDIVTGLADTGLGQFAVSVWNGTTLATSDAVITEPSAGTIRVADGSTYNTVAGYVIAWFARDPAA